LCRNGANFVSLVGAGDFGVLAPTGNHMRRIALALICWFSGTALAFGQEPSAKLPIIGWIGPATTESYQQSAPGSPGPRLSRGALARHGLIDGKNVRLDRRLAEGRLDRLPGLAEELVREGATVILAYGEAAGRAAQAATKTIPIVCVGDDLVDSGLAASLAKPGSNITGVSILATELDTKKIEVLKELLPEAKRFGVLNDPATVDPVAAGLVASLNRPTGNATGVSAYISALGAKRLELLHELVPNAAVIGVLDAVMGPAPSER